MSARDQEPQLEGPPNPEHLMAGLRPQLPAARSIDRSRATDGG